MPQQFSRRTLLSLASGAATTMVAGCTGFNDSAEPTTAIIGEPTQLSDTDTITVHDIWLQQTFIYREGPYESIGGTPNTQFIFLYASGGVEDGSFAVQVENAEYTPTTHPSDLSTTRIIQSKLDTQPPENPPESSLIVFEVPKEIDTDFVDIVYKNSTKTIRWSAGDSVRARLHFPPNLSIADQELPDEIPRGESTSVDTTLKNTGGSDATAYVRHGFLDSDSDFALSSRQIDSGEQATYTTAVTPTTSQDEITYIFDWGLGYLEHTFTVTDSSDSSNGDNSSEDDDSTY